MSFLEKLQKGMQNPQTAPETENGPAAMPEEKEAELPAGETKAVFADYKDSASPPAAEMVASRAKKPRPAARKMITAENIEEADEPALELPPEDKTGEYKKISPKNMSKKTAEAENKKESGWLNNEGQLAVDVYQTENDLVIQAAIAGIKVEDLDVQIEDEVVTVKGSRANPLEEGGDYFIEECYWGPFSRRIILPVEVDAGRADASMKDGILAIRIPKIQREKKKKVTVKS